MPSILTYNAPRIAVMLKANTKGLEEMVHDDDDKKDENICKHSDSRGTIMSPFEANLVPLKVIIRIIY